ncbi:MAG: DUF1016 N-terminal domain-containing protein [Methanoregula sp.]|uniref:DUF1016 N-terminal domain-containing protein n=1 Tax=Methanoregula sp. TaxID=2052170 RepID=UPI003FD7A723
MVSVNRELILLYWQIGNDILTRQQAEGWGAKVIDRLSRDLVHEFPDMKGFSVRNLKYMRAFAETWHDAAIVQELLAQITWYHHIALLDKVKDAKEREWYIRQTIQNRWSRNVLIHQIESGLFLRTGAAVTNFAAALPARGIVRHEIVVVNSVVILVVNSGAYEDPVLRLTRGFPHPYPLAPRS